jgi:hypothetical protein
MKCQSLSDFIKHLNELCLQNKVNKQIRTQNYFRTAFEILVERGSQKSSVTFDLFEMSYEQLKRVFWPGYPNTSNSDSLPLIHASLHVRCNQTRGASAQNMLMP